VHLRKKIAWQIQAQAEGGLSRRAQERMTQLASEAPVRQHHLITANMKLA
jgi:hypothetical protein